MPLLTIRIVGIEAAKARLALLPERLQVAVEDALREGGVAAATALASAAPQGQGSDLPVAGDATGGPLAQSFTSTTVSEGGRTVMQLKTSQPTKLKFVRYGTGIYGPTGQRIRPRVKRALFWEGAQHPVQSVAGQKPNEFVTAVLDQARAEAVTRVRSAIAEVVASSAG